jgi:hypothetical protein
MLRTFRSLRGFSLAAQTAEKKSYADMAGRKVAVPVKDGEIQELTLILITELWAKSARSLWCHLWMAQRRSNADFSSEENYASMLVQTEARST